MGIKEQLSSMDIKNMLNTPKGKGVAAGLLLIVVLLVVLAVVTFALPKPGNLAVTSPNASVPQPAPQPAPAQETTAPSAADETVITNYDLFEYKDPFRPLAEETETPLIAVDDIDDGAAPSQTTLSLLSIIDQSGEKYAVVALQGQEFTVKSGEQVGGSSFMIESIGDGSITLLYGDDRFTLQLGQEAVK